MAETDNRDLLAAMAAELADIRAEIEAAGGLVSELLRQLPAETRLSYLTRSQSFDVLSQRIEALAGLAQAVADEQPMDTALAALPLAEIDRGKVEQEVKDLSEDLDDAKSDAERAAVEAKLAIARAKLDAAGAGGTTH